MITREEVRQLAQIESPSGCAISFYFQPETPENKSHRQEQILIKDLVRECLRRAERSRNHIELREDLGRVLQVAEALHGNHSRGKVIFACKDQRIWRELDVPPRLGRSHIAVNSRFHLRPLVEAQSALLSTCIVLVDRKKARIFELRNDELTQKPDLEFDQSLRKPRSDGFGGYEAGHRERHIENLVMQNFKQFAESLLLLQNRDKFDALLVGCRDEVWSEIEPHLHSSLKQILRGRFLLDPIAASTEEVREQAERLADTQSQRYYGSRSE